MITNNDIIRSLRYTFDCGDDKMIELFALGSLEVTRSEVSDWLKSDIDPEHKKLEDKELAIFLNGLIADKRGIREGVVPKIEEELNNNIILRKLKIALNLKDFEMLALLKLANMEISKHELSAFFRKTTQSQYRPCQDQILRRFLHGMRLKYRPKDNPKPEDNIEVK